MTSILWLVIMCAVLTAGSLAIVVLQRFARIRESRDMYKEALQRSEDRLDECRNEVIALDLQIEETQIAMKVALAQCARLESVIGLDEHE